MVGIVIKHLQFYSMLSLSTLKKCKMLPRYDKEAGGGVRNASCDMISGAGAEGGGGTVRRRGCVLGGGGIIGLSATCGR